ncbi:MAG: hypothetical protein ACI88A_000893 [Paraglaciecola sp.]|jgi:hypothetical protein
MNSENIYAAPDAELINIDAETDTPLYFTVARSKLLILSIFTLNLYSVYWFYKNWQLLKLNGNTDCMPVLRAIFQYFFTHSLFASIDETAVMQKIDRAWSSFLLATVYVVLLILGNIIGNFEGLTSQTTWYITTTIGLVLVTPIPLYIVQKTVNEINGDPKGLENKSFTWLNWIALLLGLILWAGFFLGIYGSSTAVG